jgi:hypothetical protein
VQLLNEFGLPLLNEFGGILYDEFGGQLTVSTESQWDLEDEHGYALLDEHGLILLDEWGVVIVVGQYPHPSTVLLGTVYGPGGVGYIGELVAGSGLVLNDGIQVWLNQSKKVNILRKRGDTYSTEMVIRSKTTNLPLNMTGYSFLLTVSTKQQPGSISDQVFQLAGVIVDPVAGRVEFPITSEQADRVGHFYYDIQLIDGLGRKRTACSGSYVFTQDITK